MPVIPEYDNPTVLNAIRNSGGYDYQHRIPEATKANISEVMSKIFSYQPHRNEFLGALINRIGTVFVRNGTWSNPLREFWKENLKYGDTIQEIAVGLIESRIYDPKREYLEKDIFGNAKPNVEALYHSLNRREYYPITVNEMELRRAFTQENGLSSLVSQIVASPANSDAWDEFMATCSLFAEYEKNNGFFKIKVPDLATTPTPENARTVLRTMRATAENFKFPNTRYNASKIHSWANVDDIIIFGTPENVAALDVDALAAAFHMEKADVKGRLIAIPKEQFGIEKAQFVITTKDFFVSADSIYETTSQVNPVALTTNFFLHHWEVLSCSRFAPAVLLTSGDGTAVPTITITGLNLSAITVTDHEGKVITVATDKLVPGKNYVVNCKATGTGIEGLQFGVDFEVTGNKSPETMINNSGILSIGDNETSDKITVNMTLVADKSKNGKVDLLVDKSKASGM